MKYIFFIVWIVFFVTNKLSGQFNYNLSECIAIALENKKTIQSSKYDLESAKKSVLVSRGDFLPSLSFTYNNIQNKFSEQTTSNFNFEDALSGIYDTTSSTINSSSTSSAGLNLSQKIYNGGQSKNRLKQAKLNLSIAELNLRKTKIEVIQKVSNSYYGLLQAQQLFDVAEKNLNLSKQQVELVQKQFDVGAVKRTDLLKANVAKGQAKVDVLNRATTLENTRRQLFNEMGMRDFGQSIVAGADNWDSISVPTSAEALKMLKEKNPIILIQSRRINLNQLQIELAKGLRLPSLNGSVSYSAYGNNNKQLFEALNNDWNIGINFSFALLLYSGGQLSNNQEQSVLIKKQSESQYLTFLNDQRVQVELLRRSLENYAEIIPINQSVVMSAEEDLRLVQERYGLGSATILEVLDAQVSLIRSKSTLINTVHEARINETNLEAILGLLDLKYQLGND
ncbi:MAG: hypothetical protein CMG62_04275 [Candidatus Marinimicrobia bacterium]|nr:hypothetical protein [Candidatus Neomarinimicrobiota bacterium]|tara:strand:+ start:1385 stop:2743 length:1359 start_codon:yes stop_codon:yes gene_type:complete